MMQDIIHLPRDAIEVRKAERHSEPQHQTVLVREQAAAAGRRFRLPPASDASEAITREAPSAL